jgi:hypothetical protein
MAAPFESEIDRTTEGVAAPTSCQAESRCAWIYPDGAGLAIRQIARSVDLDCRRGFPRPNPRADPFEVAQ